jgi:hypothetical protein
MKQQGEIMKILKKSIFAACLVAGFSTGANASLLGDTVTASGIGLYSSNYNNANNSTIGNGVEFTGIAGYMNFDFDANTLTISPNTGVSWGGFGTYTFNGFSNEITGLSMTAVSDFTGTVLEGFTFDAHSISINMGNGNAYYPGRSSLVFNIETAQVPEPATIALMGLGLLGFAASRRKSAKSQNV